MFDLIGKPLFAALAESAEELLGSGDPCAQALREAASSGAADDMSRAETCLKLLPDADRDRIMEAAHRRLRSDPTSLLLRAPMIPPEAKPH